MKRLWGSLWAVRIRTVMVAPLLLLIVFLEVLLGAGVKLIDGIQDTFRILRRVWKDGGR